MCAKKKTNETFEGIESFADLYEKIDALQAENAELLSEIDGLRKHNERLMKDFISMEDRYGEEHKIRMHERGDASIITAYLCKRVKTLTTQLNAAKELRAVEKRKRQASVLKFVIISAIAVVLLLVPCALQRWNIIGPQLSYAIECGLMMVIAWCYALIWDRSRK